jgi:hypothetical protein
MEWLPAESVDVESDAVPPLSVIVPREVAPSKNCSVPVAAEGDTVAVNMTLSPTVEGFRDDTSAVVVGASKWPHDGN